MKIQAFSTLGEISHFAISGYFVISGFDITGVYCIRENLLEIVYQQPVAVYLWLFNEYVYNTTYWEL